MENLRSETDEINKFEFEEKQILMEEEIEKLTGEIQKLQNENQSLDLKLKSKINETVNLNAELEQIEFKSTGYYNHLQVYELVWERQNKIFFIIIPLWKLFHIKTFLPAS